MCAAPPPPDVSITCPADQTAELGSLPTEPFADEATISDGSDIVCIPESFAVINAVTVQTVVCFSGGLFCTFAATVADDPTPGAWRHCFFCLCCSEAAVFVACPLTAESLPTPPRYGQDLQAFFCFAVFALLDCACFALLASLVHRLNACCLQSRSAARQTCQQLCRTFRHTHSLLLCWCTDSACCLQSRSAARPT